MRRACMVKNNAPQTTFATELWQRIRRECKYLPSLPLQPLISLINNSLIKSPSTYYSLTFSTVPELRIYKIFDGPIGPHPIAMFEVNLFTPAQFGAFVAWLVVHRGPLSALVHPNTDDPERDHTQRAIWLGERVPLDLSIFKKKEGKEVAD